MVKESQVNLSENKLNKLYRQRDYWKRNKKILSRRVYSHTILSWLILVVGFAIDFFVVLLFRLDLKDYFLSILSLVVLFATVTGSWFIYLKSKLKKCFRKIAQINLQIAEELS